MECGRVLKRIRRLVRRERLLDDEIITIKAMYRYPFGIVTFAQESVHGGSLTTVANNGLRIF